MDEWLWGLVGSKELDSICSFNGICIYFFKPLIIKQNTSLCILELPEPVLKLTFIGHLLHARHSFEKFTYTESLNHHKIAKITTVIISLSQKVKLRHRTQN